ncbi:3-hydroxyacyl-CoA dehydrogenase family protein [Streptomyces sp. NPDC057199]|uniref:3-hydroxyacyl-CoA dehydrogenase family protein n=1 Tax=Streptomyces sp. NPDC057199 TaxID=3346047 RepID=UPI00363AB4B4
MPRSELNDLSAKPITLIGAGTMGRAIGLTLASRGGVVRLYEPNPEIVQAGVEFIASRLDDLIETRGGSAKGFRSAAVETHDDLTAAVSDAGLIIEAVPERADLKRELLGRLDELADPTAVIATNSSSFAVSTLLDNVRNPERVLNVHFAMPPEVPGVDLMSSGETREEILEWLQRELPSYGLVPFVLVPNTMGFPGNRLLEALIREALQIVTDGASTPEQVDAIWRTATGMPFGPFGLIDSIGLDVTADIEKHRRELQPYLNNWRAVEALAPLITEGRLGMKTGRGFFDYTNAPPAVGE